VSRVASNGEIANAKARYRTPMVSLRFPAFPRIFQLPAQRNEQ
jgi:hypothetical protein